MGASERAVGSRFLLVIFLLFDSALFRLGASHKLGLFDLGVVDFELGRALVSDYYSAVALAGTSAEVSGKLEAALAVEEYS